MRQIIFLFFLCATLLANNAHAVESPEDPAGAAGSGTCDWSAIKDSLFGTESASSGGYTAVGPETKYGRPLGKYQFIADTQNRMSRANPNCKGDACENHNPHCGEPSQCRLTQPLLQEACFPVQECLMDALLADNLNQIKNTSACQTLLADGGMEIGGCGQGECLKCKATESGLLAAYHLGGSDECSNLLAGAGDADNTGTSTGYYACKHGGLAVPGNCTPADYGSTGTPFGMSSPTLTYDQYLFMTESGDTEHMNIGGDSLKYIWVAAFQQMTTQFTTFMMHQVQIIGTFFDAKHQLETQRLMQQKAAKAHKDYHPSKQMCEIGTFVRDLINSEIRADLTKSALTEAMISRALQTGDSITGSGGDQKTKSQALVQTFCNKDDNAKQNNDLCREKYDPERINADIDYTHTIDMPLTLDIDLLDDVGQPEEENIFAFLNYIFMNDSFPFVGSEKSVLYEFIGPYQDMRSIVAMRSVAQNSFAEIIAQKTAGPSSSSESVGPFIKSLMREMGLEDKEIEDMVGENPSYYAQMEVLTKKIYQHPDFIANLYDKPANVKRVRAALTAIKLMQDRDIHDALMRREMLMSMLLELQLRQKQDDILNRTVNPVWASPAGEPLPDVTSSSASSSSGTF